MKIVQLAHCNPVDVPKIRQGAMDILTMVADLGFRPWYLWQISREGFSLFESMETNPNRSQDDEGVKLRIPPLRQRLAEIEALIETVLAAAVQVL
jgi:hypothetical protein